MRCGSILSFTDYGRRLPPIACARDPTDTFPGFSTVEAAFARLAKTAQFVFSFGNNGRDRGRVACIIQRYKSQVGRAGMEFLAGLEILRNHLDANLHGTAKHAVNRGAKYDEFADVDGVQKVQTVDRSRDYRLAGMPNRG
jgi:hypothetical protein